MKNNSKIVFVSGANRGIGFEFARQLIGKSCKVIAGYRDEKRSQDLLELGKKSENLFPFKVDVTSEKELSELKNFISSEFGKLDFLINNAGINENRSAEINGLDLQDLTHIFNVNLGSAFLTTKFLYPLLQKGKKQKIVNLSSHLASISLSTAYSVPYSISKAALNMLTKNQATEFQKDKISVFAISPGWVKTEMGGSSAPLTAEESVSTILKTIEDLSLPESGQFLDIDGNKIPY